MNINRDRLYTTSQICLNTLQNTKIMQSILSDPNSIKLKINF